ncbi:MAG: DNA repair protein RecO [bacterium]|nr:DNA repair protein RecO [bacterium]
MPPTNNRTKNTLIEAIVLNRRQNANGDLYLNLFDRNQGKITAIAKQAMSPLSHRSGSLEIGWYIFAHAYSKNADSPYILGRIEVSESFWDILIDLDHATWFFRVLDLVNHNIPDRYPHPHLFDNLLNLFESLGFYSSSKENPNYQLIQLTFHAFEAKLLYQLGYWPKEKITQKKWQKVIHFLLHKEPSEILSLNLHKSHLKFLNQLQNFLDQLHQSLIEYQPINPKFFTKQSLIKKTLSAHEK